jgi:hypothetical protein
MLFKLGYWLLTGGLCGSTEPSVLLADGASRVLLADGIGRLTRA